MKCINNDTTRLPRI
jgi:hypothetical protein